MVKSKTGWIILALLCVAAMLPPAPRKRHTPVTETTAGAGAAKLVAKAAPPPVPAVPDYSRLLCWNWQESYGNYWTNTIFLIKRNSNLKDPVQAWDTISWTPTNYWLFYINLDNPTMFFHVIASNTVTHLVSE